MLIEVAEGGLESDSVIRMDQVRSGDKAQLLKKLARVNPTTISEVNRAVAISLGPIEE